MTREEILEALDQEIARLEQAKLLLTDAAPTSRNKPAQSTVATLKEPKQSKRQLSPDARKRIADAQKRRWAAARAAK